MVTYHGVLELQKRSSLQRKLLIGEMHDTTVLLLFLHAWCASLCLEDKTQKIFYSVRFLEVAGRLEK